MNSVKNFLMVAGAFALTMILFAIAAPKTAHAIVATLVQITNTASNPVPVDTDNSARHAVRLYAFGNTDQNGLYDTKLLDSSNGQIFTVPAGKRLVIEQASLFAYPGPGKTVLAYWVDGSAATALPVHDQDGFGDFQGLFTMRSYVDAGNSIELVLYTAPNTFTDLSVESHLIDCNGVC
jgi:hypothetical protein